MQDERLKQFDTLIYFIGKLKNIIENGRAKIEKEDLEYIIQRIGVLKEMCLEGKSEDL